MTYISPKVSRYSVLLCVCVMSLSLIVQSVGAAGSASTLPGQAPGTPVGSFQLSGLDSVNLFNGHLNFRLPLLEFGGRGEASFSLGLPIDHRWQLRQSSPDTPDSYYPAFLSLTSVTPGFLRARHLSEGCQYGVLFETQTHTVLALTTPNGTEVELRDGNFLGQPALSQCNEFEPAAGMANRGRSFSNDDGTFTFISDSNIFDMTQAINPIETRPSGYLLTKDGTRYRVSEGQIRWMRDRNGNQLRFNYEFQGGRLTDVTDSLNRQVTISYTNSDPVPSHTNITYRGFGGAPRTINIEYANLSDLLVGGTTSTYQGLFGIGPNDQFNPWLVKLVRLPDNRTFQMRYNNYGELSRIELPTGGVFTYQWGSGNSQNQNGLAGRFVDRRVIKKSIYKEAANLVGSTSFGLFETHTSGTSGSAKIRQLDEFDSPITDERHYFHGIPIDNINYPFGYSAPPIIGREYQTDINTANGAALLRRIEHTFDAAGLNIIQTLISLTDVSPYLISKQTFSYDQLNNLTDRYEYDFGQGTPGSFLRRSHTDYVTDPTYTGTDLLAVYAGSAAHLRSLPLQRWASSDTGGINKKSLIVFEYDNYADDSMHKPLTPRSNISGLCTTFDGSGTCNNNSPTIYTTRGNVTTVTSYTNASTQSGAVTVASHYDIAGNVVKAIDARGFATQIDFSDCFGSPDANAQNCAGAAELGSQVSYALATAVTNALGHITKMQFDYYLAKPVDIADINGVVTSVEYNDLLDRTKRVIRAANQGPSVKSQTTIQYDDGNRTITTSNDLNSLDDNALLSKLLYDGLGRTIETRQYEGGTNYIVTQVQYDALSRAFKTSNPFRLWQGQTAVWTIQAFDALGRIKSVTTPDNAVAGTAYSGNRVLVTDQSLKQRMSQTDALGRLTDVWEITAMDPATEAVSFPTHSEVVAGYRTRYAYDTLDGLVGVTQRIGTTGTTQTRSFVYDSLKRLTSAMNPESGMISYQYDNNGNLTQKTDARVPAVTSTYIYDDLNRATNRSSDGTPAVTYTYDAPVPNSKGRLTSVASSVSMYSYSGYDALGRVLGGTQTTGGSDYPMSYEYDLAGNMKSQTYPSGRVVATEFDSAGRLAGVKNQATGVYYAGAAAIDAANRIQYSAHGGVSALKLGNGLWEHTNFNTRLQPTQIGLGTASTNSSVLQLDYGYGTTANNGNVLSQTITIPGLVLTQNYGYDPLNRLKTASENAGGSWKQMFVYDRYGNRRIDSNPTNTSPDLVGPNPVFSEANNRIAAQAGEQYQYDEAGNLTRGREGQSYVFDADNKMTMFNGGASQGGATYSYDGIGKRVKKVVANATTIFVYDVMGQLVAEYSDSPSAANGTRYLTSDPLGSPRVITDANGVVKARHDYQPFGEEVSLRGGRNALNGYVSDEVRQKFTAKERDNETGLDNFLARYYSSTQGRFTSPDEFNGGPDELHDYVNDAADNPTLYADLNNPQSLNKYQYTYNNPLRYVDPDGHGIWAVFAVAAEVVGTVVDVVNTVRTLRDPNASTAEKVAITVGTAAGIVLPGSYGTAAKTIVKVVKGLKEPSRKPPNPHGSRGAPDHQAEVKRQADKAQAEVKPGETVMENKQIQGVDSTKRPDVQTVGPDGKVVSVVEVERRPNSRRNRDREKEYDRLKVPNKTIPLPPRPKN